MLTNRELTNDALQILTMTRCQFFCSVFTLLIQYALLWPSKLISQITKNLDTMSPIKKWTITAIAQMLWWLIGTCTTYYVYTILANHFAPTEYYGTIDTDTHLTHSISHNIVKRNIIYDNPCKKPGWLKNPDCNSDINPVTQAPPPIITNQTLNPVTVTTPPSTVSNKTMITPNEKQQAPKQAKNMTRNNEPIIETKHDAHNNVTQIIHICVTCIMFLFIICSITRILKKLASQKQKRLELLRNYNYQYPIEMPQIPIFQTPQETIAIPTYTRRLPNSIQAQIHDSVNFAQVRRSNKILIQNSPKAPTPSLSSIEEAKTQTMN